MSGTAAQLEDTTAAPDRMPTDLKDRGWKLQQSQINDGEPEYTARNEDLALTTEPYPVPHTAIAAARKLDAANPTRAGFKTLSLNVIRTDGGTQPREQLDLAVVQEYRERMLAGDQFPPIVVFYDGSTHWLADGFHRFFAFEGTALGKEMSATIKADVKRGTQRDAVLYSLGANAIHGLPRSNADKRRAVQTLLEDPEWTTWSDNVLAGKANVSQPFVSSLRRELKSVLSESEAAPATKRRGKDNVVRETKNIGRTARTTSAEVDIKVESDPKPMYETATKSISSGVLAPKAAKPDPEGWSDEDVTLHIQINAGKTLQRRIVVSGRHGDAKPIFRQLTAGDLEPMPVAILELLDDLKKAFSRKAKPTATKTNKGKTARKK